MELLDQATFASWHDFYLTIGTATASLIGLLFVALSLNIDALTEPSNEDVRALAEQAFNSFSLVLLVAVIFLVPSSDPVTYGVAFVLLAAGATYRMLRRAPAVWRGRKRDRGEGVVWRFILPAAALLGLLASGVGLVVGQPSALHWLVGVILGFLVSAAGSSWDLLVKVGASRRAAGQRERQGER